MKKLLFILLMIITSNALFATCVTPILPARPYIYVGGSTTLTDATGAGTWSSTNTQIASIGSATGIVKGIATGSCTISYHVGSCYYTKAITVNKDRGVILNVGSNGYVTIDGQNYSRSSLQSIIGFSGADTLLGINYAAPMPRPLIYPRKATTYLDGDNSNNYFVNYASLRIWTNANLESEIDSSVNIYNSDGKQTGDRIDSMDGHNLTFDNGNDVVINAVDVLQTTGTVTVHAHNGGFAAGDANNNFSVASAASGSPYAKMHSEYSSDVSELLLDPADDNMATWKYNLTKIKLRSSAIDFTSAGNLAMDIDGSANITVPNTMTFTTGGNASVAVNGSGINIQNPIDATTTSQITYDQHILQSTDGNWSQRWNINLSGGADAATQTVRTNGFEYNYHWLTASANANIYRRRKNSVDTEAYVSDITAGLVTKLNIGDTAAMLSPYARNITVPVIRSGSYSTTGIALQTAYVFAHGLGYSPSNVIITPTSLGSSGVYYISWDATNITVNFAAAPGVVSITLKWQSLK